MTNGNVLRLHFRGALFFFYFAKSRAHQAHKTNNKRTLGNRKRALCIKYHIPEKKILSVQIGCTRDAYICNMKTTKRTLS